MRFKDFLKDRILEVSLIIFGILTIEIFLSIYNLELFIKVYIGFIILILYFSGLSLEYLIRKKFYQNLYNMIDELDEKYLVSELIKTPSFSEGKILKTILEEIR